MLRIMQLEELRRLLSHASHLVNLQESRSPEFVPGVIAWLVSLEAAMEANRLAQVGSLAALRSQVVTAQQAPASREPMRSPRYRAARATASAAAAALVDAVEIVAREVDSHRERMDEAQQLSLQVVAAALVKRVVEPPGDDGPPPDVLVQWKAALSADADFIPAMTRLDGLVGPQDTLILLDRAMAVFQAQLQNQEG